MPCTIQDQTPSTPLGGVPSDPTDGTSSPASDSDTNLLSSNLFVALIDGAGQGMKMAVGIAALLIVFLGVEALVDLALTQLPAMNGAPLSVTRILAWLTGCIAGVLAAS